MDNKTKAVFSTKHVIISKHEIVYVFHTEDDEWQFLSSDEASVEDLMIVSFESILKKDASIGKILNLEKGFQASRNKLKDEWVVSKIE